MKIMRVGLLLVLGLIAGCSVQERGVLNEPPALNRGLGAFSSEFGTLKPEAMTVFLWPEQDEEALALTIATVNRASTDMDRLSVKLDGLATEKAKLEDDFSQANCVKDWAQLGPDEDPDLIDWVSTWKPNAPVACIVNQDRRRVLVKAIDEIASVEQPSSIAKIYRALDSGYPDRVENYKSVNPKETRVTINQSGFVSIVMKDYLRKGNVQSTEKDSSTSPAGRIEDAAYDVKLKLLSFSVPELDANNSASGRIWSFKLERAPNFLGRARFVGDIKVMAGGRVVRTGTAKIEGRLE